MLGLIADHLWQSTMFAAAVALVALALRGTSARIRYWVWLAASVKFLVPFAVLVAIGRAFEWRAPPTQATFAVFEALETYGQPFSRAATAGVATGPAGVSLSAVWPYALGVVWLCGVIYLLVTWGRRWHSVLRMARRGEVVETGREVAILGRVQSAVGARQSLAVIATDEAVEPGVFGIQRPALLWPRSLGRRLSDAQMEAILTHEWAHVRGYDNLTALLHMLVRALFWFHPVVLWIGARLVAERERACDEEVVRLGNEPRTYAESILKTCEFCVESPLPCVAGVTGADLKRRVATIMRTGSPASIASWQRALLVGLAVSTVAGPLTIGMLAAPPRAQVPAVPGGTVSVGGPVDTDVFDVASVKANASGELFSRLRALPGGRVVVTNASLLSIMRTAFLLQGFQIVNGPDWFDRDRFDIAARAEGNPEVARVARMLQHLLVDRFRLQTHLETRELPVYSLVLARADRRLGPQLMAAEISCTALRTGPPQPQPPDRPNGRPTCGVRNVPGSMRAGGVAIAQLAATLAQQLGRTVVDNTGLKGEFDIDLLYTPDQTGTLPPPQGVPVPPVDGPSIFAAVQEQLGLKLESTRGLVEVLVIDRVEKPTPD